MLIKYVKVSSNHLQKLTGSFFNKFELINYFLPTHAGLSGNDETPYMQLSQNFLQHLCW